MAEIHVLGRDTIDKIAAGEVVERPGSIVKELAENAIDAGATALTIELRDGGISMIRLTDNGSGIEPDQVRTAFLRHATSKIDSVEDLTSIRSFGFRGEALSSIAAVSRVELITKCSSSLFGIRYRIEGGEETGYEEIGAPDGSTFIVRDLFYNTPARRKFLKSAQTEAGYISEFCERLALARPDLSLKFIVNGQTKLVTGGNGRSRDVIYSIYGRDVSANMIDISAEDPESGMKLTGCIGKPAISRGNRSYEIFYVNGRLIRNNILSKAAEEGYETFLMQHRFPFLILSLDLDGNKVDVNVHPAKSQVRFSEGPAVFDFVKKTVKDALTHRELVIDTGFGKEKEKEKGKSSGKGRQTGPEPFEQIRKEHLKENESPYGPMYSDYEKRRSLYEERQAQKNPPGNDPVQGNFDLDHPGQKNPEDYNNLFPAARPAEKPAESDTDKITYSDKETYSGKAADTDTADESRNPMQPDYLAENGIKENYRTSAQGSELSGRAEQMSMFSRNERGDLLFGLRQEGELKAAEGDRGGLNASAPEQTAAGFEYTERPEAALSSAGSLDTGSPDTGSPETGSPDMGSADTGSPETGSPDTGSSDTESPEFKAQGSGLSELDRELARMDEHIDRKYADERIFSLQHVKEHRLIGQIFETYWIIEFRSSMYIIDQHAAHEKVMFERLMRMYREKETAQQLLSPPIIVSLSMAEESLLSANIDLFKQIGFEVEPFGGRDYAITAVPQDLFGLTEKDYFMDMLDHLSSDTGRRSIEQISSSVATMACKAAVKGNTKMTFAEADALISELLTLDNPYNCPHGRPTIISMTKYELERKFHRIV